MNWIQFFIDFVGNWIFWLSIFVLYLILLPFFDKKFYERQFHSIHFHQVYILACALMLSVVLARENLMNPFSLSNQWFPGAFMWEKVAMWFTVIHFPSLMIYAGLFIYLWKHYNNFLPAALVVLFAVGFIELTFVPQHLFFFQGFIGLDWYSPFLLAMSPMLFEYQRFRFRLKRRNQVSLISAFILQYACYFLLPYAVLGLATFKAEFLPHFPIQTWVFQISQFAMKILFTFSFTGIEYLEINHALS